MFIFGSYIFFKLDTTPIPWFDLLLWLIMAVCTTIMFTTEELFLIATLAKMVPSKAQAFSGGARLSFSRIGATVGLLSAPFTFEYLEMSCIVMFGVSILLTFLLMLRKKQVRYPVPIF